MKTAKYRTERGAERYARELAAKHPGHKFFVVPHPFDPFHAFAVMVRNSAGKSIYAGKRPSHFA